MLATCYDLLAFQRFDSEATKRQVSVRYLSLRQHNTKYFRSWEFSQLWCCISVKKDNKETVSSRFALNLKVHVLERWLIAVYQWTDKFSQITIRPKRSENKKIDWCPWSLNACSVPLASLIIVRCYRYVGLCSDYFTSVLIAIYRKLNRLQPAAKLATGVGKPVW